MKVLPPGYSRNIAEGIECADRIATTNSVKPYHMDLNKAGHELGEALGFYQFHDDEGIECILRAISHLDDLSRELWGE